MVDTAAVGLHGTELTGITPGGTVAVIGPGPIGILAMRIAKLLEHHEPSSWCAGLRVWSWPECLGADALIDIQKDGPDRRGPGANGGVGVDEVFECSGSEGTLHQAIPWSGREDVSDC